MAKLRILVVDDDAVARDTIARLLKGHKVDFAADLRTGAESLKARDHEICFIDLKLGSRDECSGLKLIPLAKSRGIYAVVMSGYDSDDLVNRAYEAGCDDYYTKGNEAANVNDVLAKYLQGKARFDEDHIFSQDFITNDPPTRASVLEALNYARTELPILILGPSGTGKTKLAQIIHEHSKREGRLVGINCSAYPEDLLEAELFGYKRGAFTGASGDRKGKLLQADRGTLFLDEIGSMSLNMQTKLLKAIEERSFFPVGSDEAQTSEFRVVSATLENLERLLANERLRFDFLQRVSGVTVKLKPLAQRQCDILPLVRSFTRGKKRLSFTSEGKACLLKHAWPGNGRELRKFVDLAVSGPEGRLGQEAVEKRLLMIAGDEEPGPMTTERQYRCAVQHGLQEMLDRCSKEIIERHLAENSGKKTRTIRDLRVSARLLYAALRRRAPEGRGGQRNA